MASNASYPDVCSMAFSRFIVVTFQSYANSRCIELVVRRQHPAFFYLVDLICYGLLLYLRVGVISVRLGLANGLDDPVM